MRIHQVFRASRLLSPLLVLGVALAGCSSSDDNKTGDGGTTPDSAVTEGGTGDAKAPTPDKGPTPGPDASAATKPKINEILPSDGPSDGGKNGTIRVTLVGENFAPNMTVYVDGGQSIITTIAYTSTVSVAFSLPKNPYGPPYDKPALVSIQVRVGDQSSNSVDFQYTISEPMSDDFTGAVITTSPLAFRDYASEPIEAKVYAKGVTDAGDTAPATLKVQVGIAKVGEMPGKDYSFKWWDATFVSDGDKHDPPLDAKYDVFSGRVTAPLTQEYDLLYRFSTDGGATWVYADSKEDAAYVPADAVKLKVQDAPPNFCMESLDCITDKYRTTCKHEDDWKKNHCVECLESKDCAAAKFSLGPNCKEEFCTCAAKDDCTGNRNGGGCVAEGNYCGCESDDDCDWAGGEKCGLDEVNKIQICFPGS